MCRSARDGSASKGQAGRQVGIEALGSTPARSIFVRDDDIWLGRGEDNAVCLMCWHGNSYRSSQAVLNLWKIELFKNKSSRIVILSFLLFL